jgi:superfamily II DNA or RNA helicase
MVARVDQLSRNEDLQEKLRLSHWDLVVVDEAHKLSASYFGNKVNKTKRFSWASCWARSRATSC